MVSSVLLSVRSSVRPSFMIFVRYAMYFLSAVRVSAKFVTCILKLGVCEHFVPPTPNRGPCYMFKVHLRLSILSALLSPNLNHKIES